MIRQNLNCDTCEHIKYPDDGYCYMFKEKPQECFINNPTPMSFNDIWMGLAKCQNEGETK